MYERTVIWTPAVKKKLYKAVTRIVIKRFRIYYKLIDHDVVILAVLFPGENL